MSFYPEEFDDAEEVSNGDQGYIDIEFNAYGEIVGPGKSAHHFHRAAEELGVSREKVAETYNQMMEYADPENESYGPIPDGRNAEVPTVDEVETATIYLENGQEAEGAAYASMLDLLLERGSQVSDLGF